MYVNTRLCSKRISLHVCLHTYKSLICPRPPLQIFSGSTDSICAVGMFHSIDRAYIYIYEHWHRQYPAKVPKRLYTSSWSEIRVTWIAIGPFVPWTNFRKPIWNPKIDEWSCIPKLLHGRATLVFILIIVFPLGSRVHLYMTRTIWSAKWLGQQVTIAPHETHQGNSCGSDVRSGTSILRQRACSCGWWILSRYQENRSEDDRG